jgi:hypothetical protein
MEIKYILIMKNKKILTIKIEGNNLEAMRGVMDVIHTFIDYEKDIKVKKVSLKEIKLKNNNKFSSNHGKN